jgi:hypothetical protein
MMCSTTRVLSMGRIINSVQRNPNASKELYLLPADGYLHCKSLV